MSASTGLPGRLHRRDLLRAGLALPFVSILPAGPARAQSVTADALYRQMEPIATDPISGPIAEMEAMVLEFTNDARRDRGVRSLQLDTVLAQAARYHSRDMNQRDYFDHRSPDGVSARQRIGTWHRWLIGQVGENIWEIRLRSKDMRALARLAVDGWLNSPSHRDNLLQADFTHIGIGVAQTGTTWRFTQVLSTVKSYLSNPVPVSIRRGEAIDLTVDERGGSVAPSYYGLAKPDEDELTFGPYPPADSRIVVDAGEYVMWFYVQEQDYFRIYTGPWVTVSE